MHLAVLAFGEPLVLQLLDPEAGTLAHSVQLPEATWRVVFAPDGASLAMGAKSGKVYLLDPQTSSQLQAWQFGRPIAGFAYAPNGECLAAADAGGEVRLLDLGTGAVLHSWHLAVGGGPLTLHIVYAPDSSYFVGSARCPWALHDDRNVHICDTQTGGHHTVQLHGEFSRLAAITMIV
eukprot:UN3810